MLSNMKASEIIQKIKEGWSLIKENKYSAYYYISKEGEENVYLKTNSAASVVAKYSDVLEETKTSYYKTVYELKKYSKTLSLIHIRTSQSSYSTSDIHLYAEENLSSIVSEIVSKFYVNYIEVNGEIIKVMNITLAPELSIRRVNDWDKEKKKEIAEKVKKKFPFISEGTPDYYEDYYDISSIKKAIVYEKERIDGGYVITKYDSRKHTPKDYVGGFNLETFFVETLISYVEKGICYGYIGHSCRKVWVDKILAEICLKHIKNDDFAVWLTSTDGRHFGDSIEEMVQNDDRDGVRDYITKKLPSIHDKAVIYNHPEHTGDLASSKELFEKLKDMNMMLGAEYIY